MFASPDPSDAIRFEDWSQYQSKYGAHIAMRAKSVADTPFPEYFRTEPEGSESVCQIPIGGVVCTGLVSSIAGWRFGCGAYDVSFHKSKAQADAVEPCIPRRCGSHRADRDGK